MSFNKLLIDVDRGVDQKCNIGCTELKINNLFFDGQELAEDGSVLESDGNGNMSLVQVFQKRRGTILSNGSPQINFGLVQYPNFKIASLNRTSWEVSDAYYGIALDGVQTRKTGKYQVNASITIGVANNTPLYFHFVSKNNFISDNNPIFICLLPRPKHQI